VWPDGNTSWLIFVGTVTAGLSDAIDYVGPNEEIDVVDVVAVWAILGCPSRLK
jgi:hypothetical protein